MTPSSSWLAPVLTLLTLAATLGVILDSNHRAAWAVGASIIVAITFALSIRQRVLKRPLDWTLSAPSLLGLTGRAAESFTRLETPVLLLVTSVLTYFFGRRERTIAGAAEGTAG